MDDIIITSNNSSSINSFNCQLGLHFKMKDLGPLTYFLGMEVHRNRSVLFIYQTKYITNLLVKSDVNGCKPVGSPASKNKLSPSDGPLLNDPTTFRVIVGALQYISLIRSDISYAIDHICQHMHAPTEVHPTTAKCILRFFKDTLTCELHFRSGLFYSSGLLRC